MALEIRDRESFRKADALQSGNLVQGLQRVDVALPFLPIDVFRCGKDRRTTT